MTRSIFRAGGAAALLLLSGCSSLLLENAPDETQGPTVAELEQHIACEIYFVMHDDQDKSLGATLKANNFVASTTITVGVTDTGGLNPSLSFINPYHSGSGLSSTLNKTFSLGGQLAATRDRSFSFVYNIDLNTFAAEPAGCGDKSRIKGDLDFADVLKDGVASIDTTQLNNYSPQPDTPELVSERQQVNGDLALLKSDYDRLKRDSDAIAANRGKVSDPAALALDIAANDSKRGDVQKLARTSPDDTDPSKVPANWAAAKLVTDDMQLSAKLSAALAASQRKQTESERELVAAALAPGGSTPGSGGPKGASGPPATATYFSSVIDFSLTLGLNGGANWSLTHFKGPTGGTSPLLSGSRAFADSLQVSFAPTCRDDPQTEIPQAVEPPHGFWDTLPQCKGILGGAAAAKNAATYQLQLNNNLNALPQEIRRSLQQQ